MSDPLSFDELREQLAELQQKLDNAEETMRAITSGEVDAIVVDISGREQVFTLAGAETVYRVVVENMKEGAITVAADGTIYYSNQYFATMLHTRLNKVMGASIYSFVSPQSSKLLKSVLEQKNGRAEIEFTAKNGMKVHTFVASVKLQLDRLVSCAVVTDLSLQKQQEEIIKSQELIRSILEQSPNAVLVCDPDGILIYTSKASRLLFNQDVIGQPINDILSAMEILGKPLTFTDIKNENLESNECIYYRDNSDHIYMLCSFGKFMVNNETKGYVVSFTNVSDIKRTELVLERRTYELEQANKELESFSYSVSHDLRAPLRSIDGFSQLIMRKYNDKLDAKGRDYLDELRRSSQLMAQLMDDILTLSRISRYELSRKQVDMSALAISIARELKKSQHEHNVEFVIAHDLQATGDERLIKIVLENLLGNSYKFTGRTKSAKVEVGVTEMDGEKAFFVRDNGAGFDMAFIDKLFKPFHRLHTPSEFPGTGIGLASVQRIIERHGGKVWAEAALDKGATFYFTLSGITTPVKK